MAQDLAVVIRTCQQQQVMILKNYFYMPSILSRPVSAPSAGRASHLTHDESLNRVMQRDSFDLEWENLSLYLLMGINRT